MTEINVESGKANGKKNFMKKDNGNSKEVSTKLASAALSNINSTVAGTQSKSIKLAREPVKKLFRIVVRKLPVRDFSVDDLNFCLSKVCDDLKLNRENFAVEHFTSGKISRKRGPVFGAGFIVVHDELQYITFLQNCPSKCPFIAVDDLNSQPEVSPAPNQRPFKTKEKVDKYANTFEADVEFLQFKAKLEKPVEKLLSAELQYDQKKDSVAVAAAITAEQMKNNPLLKFLREKGERKMAEKRALRDKTRSGGGKSLVVTEVATKNGKSLKSKRSSSARAAALAATTAGGGESTGSVGSRGGKEVKVLSRAAKGSALSSDAGGLLPSRRGHLPAESMPMSSSLMSVAPVARSAPATRGEAPQNSETGETGPAKPSRREKEREKEKARKQQQQQQKGVQIDNGAPSPSLGSAAVEGKPSGGRGGGRGGGGDREGGRGGGGGGGRGKGRGVGGQEDSNPPSSQQQQSDKPVVRIMARQPNPPPVGRSSSSS